MAGGGRYRAGEEEGSEEEREYSSEESSSYSQSEGEDQDEEKAILEEVSRAVPGQCFLAGTMRRD